MNEKTWLRQKLEEWLIWVYSTCGMKRITSTIALLTMLGRGEHRIKLEKLKRECQSLWVCT